MGKVRNIDNLVALGDALISALDSNPELIKRAVIENPWFTEDSVRQSIEAIVFAYLQEDRLQDWLRDYSYAENAQCVGIVMAGNIPLVGFHDLISVLLSGHRAMIKMSERDRVLMQFVVDTLIGLDASYSERILTVDRLKNFDAVIATGSNSTANYFDKYFATYPHIIRRNRHAVALIRKSDMTDELKAIGKDIFSYFGMGCRNVSKIYLEDGIDVTEIFKYLEDYRYVIDHNKYKNNFDYNHALFLLNKDKFYTNDFLLLKSDPEISSRIASVHYEFYSDEDKLAAELVSKKVEIQCIVASHKLSFMPTVEFSTAQLPSLDDYADGVNTMNFLNNL